MTKGNTRKQLGVNWEAESFRLTTFLPQDGDVGRVESWWEKVVGSEPEEVISRPGLSQLQHTGTLQGQRLILAVQPGRVDWRFQAGIRVDELPERMASVGPFSDALQGFADVTHKWLDVCKSMTRMAFGAILIQQTSNRNSGYRSLAQFLPSVKIDPEGSADFLYQINRPRSYTAEIPDLLINRLTKWSVRRSGFAQIALGTERISSVVSSPVHFAIRLELDINTSADYSTLLPEDKLHEIFEELISFGKEIAEKGDIS